MVNLLDIKKLTTAQAIMELTSTSELRPYLGASQIGHSCERYLWYSFRWCFSEELSERQLRLFSRGHREEPVIIEMLNRVGITVYGEQDGITFAHGHGAGHRDGECIGVVESPKVPHLLECKTMNDKNFKDVCKQGVKVSKPVYYAQCQIYMKGYKLTRTLFVAVNKNDDSVYIERIKYDKGYAEMLMDKAEKVILSELPPSKMFEPTWYECKWCSAKKICHGSDPVAVTCRTCRHVDILPQGKWTCQKNDDVALSTEQQRLACPSYKVIEGL